MVPTTEYRAIGASKVGKVEVDETFSPTIHL